MTLTKFCLIFLKISKLCSDNSYYESVTSHDTDKVFFSFSNHSLTEHEKCLLIRRLNFAIPPRNVTHADYLLPSELLFRDIDFCEIPSYDKEFIRTSLRDCAFTSFRDSSKINENNLSKEEHLTLKDLIKNRKFVIQKADKGDIVITLNKNDYISKMKVILRDLSKFQKLSIDQNKDLNHIVRSIPVILYGRFKVHKPFKDGATPFQPILSVIGTRTCKLCKRFVPLLTPLTLNDLFRFIFVCRRDFKL